MGFFTLCILVGLWVYLSRQSDRLKRLERELSELRGMLARFSAAEPKAPEEKTAPEAAQAGPAIPAAPEPVVMQSSPTPRPPAEMPSVPAPELVMAVRNRLSSAEEKAPGPAIDWERFAGIKLFSWIGGFALFLGAGFFVKYSIEHSLISPLVRVTLSFIMGAACIGAGLYLKNGRFLVTARALCAAGVPILYAAIFAASASYHFIDPGTAFVFMSLVTAASFLMSVRMDSKYVALLALIGGFLTPPLLSTGADSPFALFGYIFLLDAGIAATFFRTRWDFLLPLALIGTGIMEIGWFNTFFTGSRVMTGSVITALFAGFSSALITLAPSFSIEENKTGRPCGLFLLFSIGLTAFMLGTGDLASRPGLLFTLLLAINALFAWHAYKSRYFVPWQGAASLFVFLIIADWSVSRLTPALLGVAFIVYLVFSALNAALPVITWKLRGEKRGELVFAGLYPLLGLALVLVAMLKQTYVSFLFWPVVFLLDALAIVVGFLVSALWIPVACLALTVAGGFVWLSKISQTAALGGFMAVFAFFTVAFLGLGVYLLRVIKERSGDFGVENIETVKAMPYLTAAAPFLLIIMAAAKLKPEDPSLILGFGLLMSVVMLIFARIYSMGPLTIPALGGAFLLAVTWHSACFEPVRATGPLIWYAVYMLVFIAFPVMFKEQFTDSRPAWSASAVSGPLFFIPVYDAVSRTFGKDLIGLLPAAFAVLYFLALREVIKHKSSSYETQNFRLALTGGVALFFVTLIFPLQFDKEWITLAWAIEGAALVWLFGRVPHEGLKKWGYCLLLISFFRLTFNTAVFSYHPRQLLPVLNWYLYTYLTAAAAMFTAASLWRPEEERIMNVNVKSVLMGCGAALLFLLMNIEIADYFSDGASLTFQFSGNVARDLAYTLGWSAFASLLFGFGIKNASRAARQASIGIFAAAILKLFLHDVWSLGQLYRVAAFMVTAVILILVSFLYQKHFSGEKAPGASAGGKQK